MDAVRDVPDLGVDVLERGPHLARDLAVQRGDAVRVGGEAQRHGREPERFGLAELAEREQVLLGDAGLVRERRDVVADQRGAEDLVAGGDGRVGGEDGGGLDVRDRVVGRHAVLDERADALDREEGGVALVHVEDVRVDAERLERTDAADAEQQLLADAVLAVAGVERVGEHLDLEQVERDGMPTSLRQTLAEIVSLSSSTSTVTSSRCKPSASGSTRSYSSVWRPASSMPWREVAAAVEQPDADERHAELSRRLQVVAGEDAEAAAVDRQRLLDPELHREVGDAGARVRVVVGLAPPGALLALHAPRKLPVGPTRSGAAGQSSCKRRVVRAASPAPPRGSPSPPLSSRSSRPACCPR